MLGARPPRVRQRVRQAFREPQSLVEFPKRNQPGVAGELRLDRFDDHVFAKQRKAFLPDTLSTHAAASVQGSS